MLLASHIGDLVTPPLMQLLVNVPGKAGEDGFKGPKHLYHPLLSSQAYYKGGGSEVKQLEDEPEPI